MKKLLPLLFLTVYSIGAYAQPTVSFSVVTTPCHNDGVLSATFTGLTPPLTVNWYTEGSSGTTITHTSVSGLSDVLTSYSGGPLTISATDTFGVTDTGAYFGSFPYPFYTCGVSVYAGVCPAPDTLYVCTGLGGPFTYQWFDYTTMAIVGTVNPLVAPAGHTYGVNLVSTSSGCTYGADVDPSLTGYAYPIPTFYDSVHTTVAACTNGTATVTIYGGGTGPFTYLWTTGATTPSIGSLVMGTYGVTVTDAMGCYATGYGYVPQSITITAPVVATPATCLDTDGAVIAFGSGGTPPYSYIWSNGATTQSQTHLGGGSYNVNVTDANGCIGSDGGFVGVSTPIVVTYTTTPSLCTVPNGTATLAPAGGTAPYSIAWYTAPPQTGPTAASLTYGLYTFHITDAAGCTQNGTVYIPPVDVISASFLATPATCTLSNGSMTVYPTGGITPYAYHWNTGASTPAISSVPAGAYMVTITDAMGCVLTKYPILPDYSPLTIGTVVTPASCIFTADGIDSAVVSGGTTPYSYAWSSGGTTRTISALPTGPYWVTATDAAGCTTDWYYSFVPYDTTATSCYCTIEGTVYYDINGNCVQDPGEPGIPNIQIHITNGTLNNGYTYTDASGHYSYKVPSGSYTVSETVLAFYPLAACQLNNIAVTAVAGTGCVNTVNFADAMDTIHDMHISTWDYYWPHMVPGTAVIGHTYIQTTIISNDGTVTEDSVYVGYKPDGQILGPSFVPGGYFGGSPYWYPTSSFPSLAPGTGTQFLIDYTVPTNIPINTPLTFLDTVVAKGPASTWTADYSPWNNVNSFPGITVGSFDPNFKEVNPKGTGPLGIIPFTDSVLEYMVHFQNTGTWPAENIVVLDTLDGNLNWTTLRPVYESGKCKITMTQAGTKHIARFEFDNINLPAATADQLLSNGMFTYTIHLQPGLATGTQIKNNASIYFDYNAPVKTNTTVNTLGSSGPGVSVQNVPSPAVGSFAVYPNPATNAFNAIINSENAGAGELIISDVAGKALISRNVTLQKGPQTIRVDVAGLASGTYFVSIDVNGTRQTQKLVVIKS